MGLHPQAMVHGPCRDRSLVQWLHLWTWVEDFCIGCLPMVAWWHSSQHIPGSQTCTWTIARPSIFESIGFVSCTDCNPLLDLSCTTLRGHQADLLMFPLDAVYHPSLLISLQPWTSNWMVSICSKASEIYTLLVKQELASGEFIWCCKYSANECRLWEPRDSPTDMYLWQH